MAKGKKASKSDVEQSKRYKGENRWEKNKLRRLARHCKHNVNDFQSKEVLDSENVSYTRNKFKNNKLVDPIIKLKMLHLDTRKTIEEQIRELDLA